MLGLRSDRERNAVKTGLAARTRIRPHYSWAPAVALITAAVGTHFPEAYPLTERIVLGLAASLLFFLSMMAHELVHRFMAVRNGLAVGGVTLYAFGGVSRAADKAAQPSAGELLVAVVGPLSSLVVAGIFYAVYLVLAGNVVAAALVQWLGFINVALALFNLIPGYPLDGGKILGVLLWKRTGDYQQASRITTLLGWGVGWFLTIAGMVIIAVGRQWPLGALAAFLGWSVGNGAAYVRGQVRLREALQGITARSIMAQCSVVSGQLGVAQLVSDHVAVTGQRCFAVCDSGILQGIVTVHDVRAMRRKQRVAARVSDVMTPASKLESARPDAPVSDLLERMTELQIGQMLVLEEGNVVGMVTRDSLLRLIKTRSEVENWAGRCSARRPPFRQ